jgi:hypothetical protein
MLLQLILICDESESLDLTEHLGFRNDSGVLRFQRLRSKLSEFNSKPFQKSATIICLDISFSLLDIQVNRTTFCIFNWITKLDENICVKPENIYLFYRFFMNPLLCIPSMQLSIQMNVFSSNWITPFWNRENPTSRLEHHQNFECFVRCKIDLVL